MSHPMPPPELLEGLRAANQIVVTSHANPDGDAIGSSLGAARILRSLGKGVTVWLVDPVPALYRSLPGSDRIWVGTDRPETFQADTALVLECPKLERTGLETQLKGLACLNVDHHLGNQHYGDVNWIDTSAAAVGELVHSLALALGVRIDAMTAQSLYVALSSDTGGFRFSNTSANSFRTAAELVDAGASPEQASIWLYESRPLGAVRLQAAVLGSLELHFDGRLASAHLTQAMLEAAGAVPSDSEGLIDVPRLIDGVEVVTLVREIGVDSYKISLRSRSDSIDVERIARESGGGGHRNAAGFELDGSLDDVSRTVVTRLETALGETS